MMRLELPPGDRPLSVLALGAHADDIEIGCGGTLLSLAAGRRPLAVTWVVLSGDAARRQEAETAAGLFLAGVAARDVRVHQFRDGFFPSEQAAIKEVFESLKGVEPDVIFTHTRDDRHQDHRVVSDLTWNTFRRHLVLEYEIPKYDGDLGRPNAYVELSEPVLRRKLDHLHAAFPSQRAKSWFTEETFRGLARIRGIESGAGSGYAEGFHARKVRLAV